MSLEITFRRITNFKHMLNIHHECIILSKDECYQNPKVCLTLILLPRIMLFFKPEVLKNGINFNYGIAFRESALYRLALAGHKKRIIS